MKSEPRAKESSFGNEYDRVEENFGKRGKKIYMVTTTIAVVEAGFPVRPMRHVGARNSLR